MMLHEIAEKLLQDDNAVVRTFAKNLPRNGGWRMLFDPYSSEWDDTDMSYKVATLKSILSVVSLTSLMLAYKNDFAHRPDIVDAFDFGLCKITNYALTGKTEI